MNQSRKAVAAAAVPVIAALSMWAATGTLNAPELSTALSGLLTAALVYLVPNAAPSSDDAR